MGLHTCPDCGGDVSDRASACPHCGAPMANPSDSRNPKKVVVDDGTYAAGAEAGRGCALFFTSAPMAFVIFFVSWFVGCTFLAVRTGVYQEGVEPPLWLGFALFVAPIIVAIVGRKVIRRVIPIIVGSGVLIVSVIAGLLLLLLGASMIFGLFFHWPGAH